MKAAFLTVMPSPYVQDVFAALDADGRCELRVFYLEQEADDTHWGEQVLPGYAEVLPGSWIWLAGGRVHFNRNAIRRLREYDADVVVVVGYPGVTNQAVMHWLWLTSRTWVFWGESPGMQTRGLVGSSLRRIAQRAVRRASVIAGVGSKAVAEYRRLIGDRGRDMPIMNVPYHCATDAFERASTCKPARSGEPIRFLYCGQLIERKGVDLLVTAFLGLRAQYPDVQLRLIGTGPLAKSLTDAIPMRDRESVIFEGFRPVEDLPELFAAADVFVLPSRYDGWGVVVNQAVAAGLPVITTSAVGAANDLVSDGESGWVVEPGDVDALRTSMETFAADPTLIKRFGAVSRWRAKRINLHQAVADWISVFETAIDRDSRSTQNAYREPVSQR